MLPYRRADRVGNLIMHEIAEMIRKDLDDPRLHDVSITRVVLSGDLKRARVYFSMIGATEERESALKGLEHAAGRFKKVLGQKLRLRFVPELLFLFDSGLEHSQRIEDILHQIHASDKEDS